jgi:hypothetical protein
MGLSRVLMLSDPSEGRVRHQAGVVYDDVDASVGPHGGVDKVPDLFVLRDVGLHGSFIAERRTGILHTRRRGVA